ncbi:MAG: hypothetical protein Q9227_008384 [Pyrenula ochraceoflavens]
MSTSPTVLELRQKIFGTTDADEIKSKRGRWCRRESLWKEKLSNMSVPYYRAGDLPAPIPTPQEIEMARKQPENNLTAFRGLCFSNVYRLHGAYAVKVAKGPKMLREAENLLYLEKHCKVRAPRLYALFAHQGCDPEGLLDGPDPEFDNAADLPSYYYLVMDYIPGSDCWSDKWAQLNQIARANICRKLGEQVRLLRDVPPPSPTYYGRIEDQGFPPSDRLFLWAGERYFGPYYSHEAFLEDILRNAEGGSVQDPDNVTHEFKPSTKLALACFRQCMAQAPGHESKLTLVDLAMENIRIQGIENSPDDYDVVIIDWADLAWLPSYVQATLMLARSRVRPDPELQEWEISKGFDFFPYSTALFLKEFWLKTNSLSRLM